MRFYRIGNEQAPHDHLAMVIVGVIIMIVHVVIGVIIMIVHVVVVVVVVVRERDWIDNAAERDYPRLIRTGAM